MTWIFLAVTANFFWSLVNIGDKYVITNKLKSPYVYLVLLTWSGILAVFFIPFVDFFVPDIKWLIWIALASALYLFGGLPYVKAVKLEDISRINIWWNLIPVFSLIFAWWLIDEQLSEKQLLAFLVLFVGSIIASVHLKNKKMALSKALPWMILATVCYAGYAVIIRYVTQSLPFMVAYIWNGMIIVLLTGFIFISKKFRSDFKQDIKNISGQTKGTVISIALLDELGMLFNIWALSLGPVALIFALEGAQTIFVFLLAVLISLFRPHIIKEELNRNNIILKLVALLIILLGIVMLNL